jgi:two-component system, NarL family, nitrate/nitrite response regulator NarL
MLSSGEAAKSLTARERDVAVLISYGLSNKEIARRLGIRLPTVKTYVGTLLLKFNARNRTEIALMMVESRTSR